MGNFKIQFNLNDYLDVLPDISEYCKHDQILNFRELEKGNIDNCVWKRYNPTKEQIKSESFRATEANRILNTGVWIAIKDEILWLPPNYYFALQYGTVGEKNLEFRLKRLKHVYQKIRVRNNPYLIGTMTIKNRQDGETTMAINDAMWEMADGNMFVGTLGIQSMDFNTAKLTCWKTAQIFWQSYPKWIKKMLYPDFVSGDKTAQKMQFTRDGDEEKGVRARNVRFEYFSGKYNSMDGINNARRVLLDEFCKWPISFYDTFINYKRFIAPGFNRAGIFDIFSSPADVPTKSNDEAHYIWQKSDPSKVDENGATESGLYRIYSNPLDGIEKSYDKWGDADPDMIYSFIMKERKSVRKDKLLGTIRGYPLNEDEMFGSTDSASVWMNLSGIKARKLYIMSHKYKDEETKEPAVIYGTLEWHNGVPDTDVDLRPADVSSLDEKPGVFGFSYLPVDKPQLRRGGATNLRGEYLGERPLPLNVSLIEGILGVDPYAKRYNVGYELSKGAMVHQKFRDFYGTGIKNCPTMIYSERPTHDAIFHENVIKAAVFTRSLVQPENITDKLIDYMEDRGYIQWTLPKIGHRANSVKRGDAPSSKGAYLSEMKGFIDAITNLPLDEDSPYLLKLNWFKELLEQVEQFDDKNTQKFDLVMAWGASLIGVAKVLNMRQTPPSNIGNLVLQSMGLM